MTEDKLDDIKALLDDIKGLLLATNQDKLDALKKSLLKAGSIESQVYDLCDGINTTQVIADKIQKSQEYVRAVLTTLRNKGLIKTVERDGNKAHEQRF
jgi:DNA-binding FadR family transcriptional regulator